MTRALAGALSPSWSRTTIVKSRTAPRLARYAAALALVTGCASTSPRPAFRDTAKLVEERTDQRITWNQGGTEDAAVAEKLRELLSRTLTVDGAVQVSLLNNKTLQATYEDLSVAQADVVQAGLLQNPVFGAGVAFPIAGQVRTGVDVSVTTDFLSVFVLAARRKVAEAELRATKLRVADAVLRVAAEVESAFYQLSAAQQIAAMRRTILEAGDAALDLAARQHQAGNISDLDLANQEALYEQVRTDLVRSEVDVIAARESLTRHLGLWGADTTYRVADKLPELPTDEVELTHLESLAVSRRLDLGAAREEAQAVSHALAMAKNYRWLGASSVGAAYDRAPEHFTVIGPRAELEIPLFDQKQAVIARLEGQLRAALARESALAVAIRSEVRAVRTRVAVARAVVDRYANVVVPLRQRVVTLSQEQYNAMLLGAHQLLLAKQNEVNAYREFIEALRDYWTARAELERATGGVVPMPKTKAGTSPSAPEKGARP
ncbi:MAG TPA: TolC family protein [Polyangiaceae bacterium]|nr:TolC family protein [Polyangiaceae bacterium]